MRHKRGRRFRMACGPCLAMAMLKDNPCLKGRGASLIHQGHNAWHDVIHPTAQVPFEMVSDLVATRRVLLRGGLAYVGKDQIASLVRICCKAPSASSRHHDCLCIAEQAAPSAYAGRAVRDRKAAGPTGCGACPRQVVGHFRAGLSKGLAVTARRWASHICHAEGDRLAPVVESLSSRCWLCRRAVAPYARQLACFRALAL